MHEQLLDVAQSLWVIASDQHVGVAAWGSLVPAASPGNSVLGFLPALPTESLGDPAFKATYGTRYAYYAGAMANAIASEEMIIALGKAGLMGSFGAGGCLPARIETAIQKIQQALPNGPYAFNLLNSPFEPALEQRAVELYLKHNVRVIEASAYMDITFGLVHYRAAGLAQSPDGQVIINNRIIAKISRKEVAKRFLSPAPQDILNKLLEQGKITPLQAELARLVPMADDITAEADSGGHTDNRPLIALLPAILAQRDAFQVQYNYAVPVRVGAAGGIGTPTAAMAAFAMGAAYIVTGSVNQSCREAGASEYTRNLLAKADMADVSMAPAADMFEMGVRVQVLKRGSMFAPRAGKLHDLYSRYNAWEEIPLSEREKLESTVFKRPFDEIWADTVKFFTERDPRQVERGIADPHQKMALVFRWYLGLSSRWSNVGEKGREMDYQIWCGPSMGAFNDWVKGAYLAQAANRGVVDVALHLLTGAAYLTRMRQLAELGLHIPAEWMSYLPKQPLADHLTQLGATGLKI
ncbi:MAG: PfaD family polyunsaturated fatty acid/polyketide biosynthesis protein [Anaerolineaceae bacterium]|nr:PfaD family polyunsaturated fatty acid/polyketide biosynthesis protein [Anaerolineaceae bacterium]